MVAGWQEALAEAIADHGLAYARSPSGRPQAPRGAPPLIQVLGASGPPFPGFAVTPAETGRRPHPSPAQRGDRRATACAASAAGVLRVRRAFAVSRSVMPRDQANPDRDVHQRSLSACNVVAPGGRNPLGE